MKTGLIYFGFEKLVDTAIDLGKFESHLEAIEVAGAHHLMGGEAGDVYCSGYLGVDRRKTLIWPGDFGWICLREERIGVIELSLHEKYMDVFATADVDVEEYESFILKLIGGGFSLKRVIDILDESQSDSTQIEMVFNPLVDSLNPALNYIKAQLTRLNAGDPVLRRRIDEELSGAVSTFYNANDEVQIRVWRTLSRLIEDDRRFNNLTRIDTYQDFKDAAVSQPEIAMVLAWVIDYAYEQAIIVPMWDAIVAPVGAEYIPTPDASIKTIGIMSQIGKLTRDDPEFVEKMNGIAAAMITDERYSEFSNHPGYTLFDCMRRRIQDIEGPEAAAKHLSWPLYQLALQYSIEHGIVR